MRNKKIFIIGVLSIVCVALLVIYFITRNKVSFTDYISDTADYIELDNGITVPVYTNDEMEMAKQVMRDNKLSGSIVRIYRDSDDIDKSILDILDSNDLDMIYVINSYGVQYSLYFKGDKYYLDALTN